MKPISFEKQTHVIAKHQPEYQPLPVKFNEETGVITSCWVMTEEEKAIFNKTGIIYLHQNVGANFVQPVNMEVTIEL
jgi:hypothetical protein